MKLGTRVSMGIAEKYFQDQRSKVKVIARSNALFRQCDSHQLTCKSDDLSLYREGVSESGSVWDDTPELVVEFSHVELGQLAQVLKYGCAICVEVCFWQFRADNDHVTDAMLHLSFAAHFLSQENSINFPGWHPRPSRREEARPSCTHPSTAFGAPVLGSRLLPRWSTPLFRSGDARFAYHIPLYIYIIQLSDINVKTCACDSLYRTIIKFSFLLF